MQNAGALPSPFCWTAAPRPISSDIELLLQPFCFREEWTEYIKSIVGISLRRQLLWGQLVHGRACSEDVLCYLDEVEALRLRVRRYPVYLVGVLKKSFPWTVRGRLLRGSIGDEMSCWYLVALELMCKMGVWRLWETSGTRCAVLGFELRCSKELLEQYSPVVFVVECALRAFHGLDGLRGDDGKRMGARDGKMRRGDGIGRETSRQREEREKQTKKFAEELVAGKAMYQRECRTGFISLESLTDALKLLDAFLLMTDIGACGGDDVEGQ